MQASAGNRGGKGVQEALFGMMVHTIHACIYMYIIFVIIYFFLIDGGLFTSMFISTPTWLGK